VTSTQLVVSGNEGPHGPLSPIPTQARSVVVMICGGLADVVQALAPLKTIREHHAGATLIVLTQPPYTRLFKQCPWVDQVETRWQPNKLMERLAARWGLLLSKIDVVYDLTNTPETSALLRRFWPRKPLWSGTAEGCSHPHADRSVSDLHRLDRHGEQLCLAGLGPPNGYPLGAAPLPDVDWLIAKSTDETQAEAQGIVGRFAILLPEPLAGLAAVQWPVSRYTELAQALHRRGLKPVIAGGPTSVPLATTIRKAVPDALDLTARLDLMQFISLAREAALVVGGESDMTVLAATSGAPTVTLINPAVRVVAKVAPRGSRAVTLVARNFTEIAITDIMKAARSVQDDDVLQVVAA
jgi:ADP-heptose:LPS heptosyltransferase